MTTTSYDAFRHGDKVTVYLHDGRQRHSDTRARTIAAGLAESARLTRVDTSTYPFRYRVVRTDDHPGTTTVEITEPDGTSYRWAVEIGEPTLTELVESVARQIGDPGTTRT